MPLAEIVPWILIPLLQVFVLAGAVWFLWSFHRIRIAAEELVSELRRYRAEETTNAKSDAE